MTDYRKVATKIMKLPYAIFKESYNCGLTSEYHPVNLYFETSDLKFYVSCDFNKWSIDHTDDMELTTRTQFKHIGNIKNQTEAINIIKCLLSGEKFKLSYDGRCVIA